MQDGEDVIPFDILITEMYNNQDNMIHIKSIGEYIQKNKRSYCIIHLYTIMAAVTGYTTLMKIK